MAQAAYNFAIFIENVKGRDDCRVTMYQAHGWTMDGWMPVAPPADARYVAHGDAHLAYEELRKRGWHGGHPFRLDPALQRYDWIGRRQL